jgi:RNA polymerase sigma factor (TIGR02999 family)
MSDVTQILNQINNGDDQAMEQLTPLVYDELRSLASAKLAREKPGQTLQATALVHEAFLRLIGSESPQHWSNSRHFFGAAAEAMRRILIENARSKGRIKRGGDWKRVDYEHVDFITTISPSQLLMLDEAISLLAAEDEIAGELVRLRYFAGLSLKQASAALEISSATAYRHWAFARSRLHNYLINMDS